MKYCQSVTERPFVCHLATLPSTAIVIVFHKLPNVNSMYNINLTVSIIDQRSKQQVSFT